jgi:hypothetical protein
MSTTLPPSDPVPGANAPKLRQKRSFKWLWQGRVFPAFWTITGVISLVVNIILVVALLLVGRELFDTKELVVGLVGGLHSNFVKMDAAHIKTTIQVRAQIPVTFDLPVKTNTTVILTEDTNISNARVSLATGGLSIYDASTNITLPAGTSLPIALDITVPVNIQIPVQIPVNVDIPLNQTELHDPFTGLQTVVKPYLDLLGTLPDSWDEVFHKGEEQEPQQ